MAIPNHERVGKALELLRDGLRPFVARELEARHGKYWITTATAAWSNELVWREGEDAPQRPSKSNYFRTSESPRITGEAR